jgi:GxxExxY protein
MNADEDRYNRLSERVIGRAFTISNTLGAGFLEKVYDNALDYEPGKAGPPVIRQVSIDVTYDGQIVGHYIAGMVGCRRHTGRG